jgi:hypothetical protein
VYFQVTLDGVSCVYITGIARSTIIRIAFLKVKSFKSSSVEMGSIRGDFFVKGIMGSVSVQGLYPN